MDPAEQIEPGSESDSEFEYDSYSSFSNKNLRNTGGHPFLMRGGLISDAEKAINNNLREMYSDLHDFEDYFLQSIYEIKSFLVYLRQTHLPENRTEENTFQFPQNPKLEVCVKKIGWAILKKIIKDGFILGPGDPDFIEKLEEFEQTENIFEECFHDSNLLKNGAINSNLSYYMIVANNDVRNLNGIKDIIFSVLKEHQEKFESEFLKVPTSSIISLMVEAVFGLCLMMGGFIAMMSPIVHLAISVTLLLSGLSLFILRVRAVRKIYLYRKDEEKKDLAEKEFIKINKHALDIFTHLAADKRMLENINTRKEVCLLNLTVHQNLGEMRKLRRQVSELNNYICNNQSSRENPSAYGRPTSQSSVYLERTRAGVPVYSQPLHQAEQSNRSFGHLTQNQGLPSAFPGREQAGQYIAQHAPQAQPLNHSMYLAPTQGPPSAFHGGGQVRQQYSAPQGQPQPFNQPAHLAPTYGVPAAFHGRQQYSAPQGQPQPFNQPAHLAPTHGMSPAFPSGARMGQYIAPHASQTQPQLFNQPMPLAHAQHEPSDFQPRSQAGQPNVQHLTQSGEYSTQRADQAGFYNEQRVEQAGSFSSQHASQTGTFNIHHVKQEASFSTQVVIQQGKNNRQFATQKDSLSEQNMAQAGVNNTQHAHQMRLANTTVPVTEANLSELRLTAPVESTSQKSLLQRTLSMSPTPPLTPRTRPTNLLSAIV